MTLESRPRFITPPREEEEIYPYRRVWRSLLIENGIIIVVYMLVVLLTIFIGLELSATLTLILNLALAILPAALWLIFAWLPERRAILPRSALLSVFVLATLLANAISLPMLDAIFRPQSYLPSESLFVRIAGYSFSLGALFSLTQLTLLRLTVFPQEWRMEQDSIAYAEASAIGYALVVHLRYVLSATNLSPDVVAIRVLTMQAAFLIGALLIGYGLARLISSRTNIFLLPLACALAALLPGVATAIRPSLVNAVLGTTGAATRPLFALGFGILILVLGLIVVYFIFFVAKRREQDRTKDVNG